MKDQLDSCSRRFFSQVYDFIQNYSDVSKNPILIINRHVNILTLSENQRTYSNISFDVWIALLYCILSHPHIVLSIEIYLALAQKTPKKFCINLSSVLMKA